MCESAKFNSLNDQASKVRPEILNVNSNEPVFYPFSNKTRKCSGSYNNINGPYAKLCVADTVQDLHLKVLSKTNEKRHIKWLASIQGHLHNSS